VEYKLNNDPTIIQKHFPYDNRNRENQMLIFRRYHPSQKRTLPVERRFEAAGWTESSLACIGNIHDMAAFLVLTPKFLGSQPERAAQENLLGISLNHSSFKLR
jgi:hypothetical protein